MGEVSCIPERVYNTEVSILLVWWWSQRVFKLKMQRYLLQPLKLNSSVSSN